ncbi:MAG: ankyrin repeat domain-containing protein [Haliea sp.]|nr:ankyrin repeat domain-containing protein [Haliea sp.]
MVGKVPRKNPRPGVDGYGRAPLHYAAADGNAAEVSRLLAEGASPNVQDDNGWTPAHFAAQAGSLECMSALLAAGADPALADSYGNTVLWRAVFASKGEGKLIRALRAAGADPHVTNKHGVSPLALAHTIANYDVRQYFSDLPYESQ